MVEELLRAGADVNAQNNLGNTPLHWVAMTQNVDVLEVQWAQAVG